MFRQNRIVVKRNLYIVFLSLIMVPSRPGGLLFASAPANKTEIRQSRQRLRWKLWRHKPVSGYAVKVAVVSQMRVFAILFNLMHIWYISENISHTLPEWGVLFIEISGPIACLQLLLNARVQVVTSGESFCNYSKEGKNSKIYYYTKYWNPLCISLGCSIFNFQ